ncbi:Uncharacterised protein [BD1-7 clade bacterium]|uniref:Uncharacterized protein n=1 Tax=BD1-7 clade bacterium TaxID=2029982 RepID=A0A5S9MRQ5_9GAMM|nr:Uncharacterised protein [BD1-7 clade bacterium]CAA0081929.1 Uncharacterised protein [BD1-7 clade bacterium]CAA0085248.1 Uncharacterised protein [BD1-7 clade bacterium]
MAAHSHPTGRYRAYKKINGREHQFYFRTLEEAQAKQKELDSMARLKPKKVFADCGRLVGFRFYRHKRNGHVAMRVQVRIKGKDHRTEYVWRDSFEALWNKTIDLWSSLHGLHSTDLRDYREKIRDAKRIYLRDLAELESLELAGALD